MDKAIEAAARALAMTATDSEVGWEHYLPEAKEAVGAFLKATLEGAYGNTLTEPEIAMQEAVWIALPDNADLTISDLNRAVRAGYRAALSALEVE